MSPSMKSKSMSKDKASARAVKEQQKASPKTTNHHGSGIPASAYNPILGTFHTLETSLAATSSVPLHENSNFMKIDDTDEHSSSSPQGTVSEYDSVSNNGSCSGESEDHKEKAANSSSSSSRLDTIPGCDNDRREKIRLKNERKHQRQRERRAQQLHDRCCGYLMSRKLESLAQQLMAMGFSSERATLALMLNDGKLEQSVSWLFEGSEEESHTKDVNATTNLLSDENLKIDISEELSHISAMEVRYNCSKQEVERVVVACEGDLHKAEHTLQSQKETKPEDSSAENNSLMRSSQGFTAAAAASSVSLQQRGRSETEFNSVFQDLESRNLLLNHPNEPLEKRWGVTGSSPSHMLPMAPFVKPEGREPAGKMIQQVVVGREAAVMAQRPQFTNAKPNSAVSSSIDALPAGWYAPSSSNTVFENLRSNGQLLHNHNIGSVQAPYNEYSSYALGLVGDSNSSSAWMKGFYKPMGTSSSSSPSPPPTIPSQHQRSWNMNASSSSSLTFPPALGLFSAHQNAAGTYNSQHSRVDWNTRGLMPEFDYTSIDWTLDYPSSSSSSSSSKAGGLWLGISSLLRNSSGLQNVGGMARESSSSSGGLREWTSPFAGKDIFSVPRQFVTSPPL